MPSLQITGRRAPRRAALLIDAPAPAVRDAILAPSTWTRAATAAGLSLTCARDGRTEGPLVPGDVLRVGPARRSALFRVVDSRLDAIQPPDETEVLRLAGMGRVTGSIVTVSAAETGAGSLVTVQVHGSSGSRRVRTLRRAQLLLGVITLVATTPAAGVAGGAVTGPSAAAVTHPPVVVVAGVVVRDGAILAARRTYPPELAGYWECPGGKVEPGESETDALARELAEELGIGVTVASRIGSEYRVGDGHLLHVYRAELTEGEPSPTVHDAVRWVTADEVDTLPWLPSDAPLIPELRRLLDPGSRAVTASPSSP